MFQANARLAYSSLNLSLVIRYFPSLQSAAKIDIQREILKLNHQSWVSFDADSDTYFTFFLKNYIGEIARALLVVKKKTICLIPYGRVETRYKAHFYRFNDPVRVNEFDNHGLEWLPVITEISISERNCNTHHRIRAVFN